MEHVYDGRFMHYTDRGSRYSAQALIRLLSETLPIASVLDIGCARGAWLQAWREAGVEDVFGVDGDYVDQSALQIPPARFSAADLAGPIDLERRFDLVQSLEVAEHVRAGAADGFVENIVQHSRGLVLFSAAPPGQGGEFHVNEQPYDYWRRKFAARGFAAFDWVRPLIADDRRISFWYRYNTLLYVHEDKIGSLPERVRMTRVDSTGVADITPAWFRLRKLLVRHLPHAAQHALARSKAHLSRVRTR
ncbi:MAG: methyltransferase domain-containing protein [Rhodanobacteraceae bacterium]